MSKHKYLIRALTVHSKQALKALAESLTAGCSLRHISAPNAGLGLLTLKDGSFHESYYLGEFPLSSCRLELSYPDGRKAEGGAQIMADDEELATSLAVLDAVLAAKLPGWEKIQKLVALGEQKRKEQDKRRNALLATTKVDFAPLAEVGDGDDA